MSKEISLFKTFYAFLAVNIPRFIKRDRSPPEVLSASDSFDEYACDDYTDF